MIIFIIKYFTFKMRGMSRGSFATHTFTKQNEKKKERKLALYN